MSPQLSSSSPHSQRLPLIDELRGVAFVLMAIFHFCYDLAFFRIIYVPLFTHPFWIGFRMVILLLFLGMVGVCLTLNHKNGFNGRRYLIRLGKLVAAALIITLATYIAMRDFYIFFGIIHMIALSSLLALPFLWIPAHYRLLYGLLGVVLLFAGQFYALDLSPNWVWLWMAKQIPNTADYVPLVPWFGFVLVGLMLGHQAEQWGRFSFAPGYAGRALRWCGRHALLLYLIHQPILWIGFLAFLILR